MHTDLRDLLPAVEAEAPPLRHTADDIIARSRRRRNRRRATWAAAAAVLLVGAGIAVTTPSEEEPQPVLGYSYPVDELTGNIPAYTAGFLTVSGTVRVSPGFQAADVTDGETRTDDGQLETVAQLTVFRPGVFDPAAYLGGEPVTIDGRPGKFRAGAAPTLVWEYQENAFGVVSGFRQPRPMTRDELVAVADSLNPGPETRVRMQFRLTYVPAGWSLSLAGQNHLELVQGQYPRTLREADVGLTRSKLRLNLLPRGQSKAEVTGNDSCVADARSCYRLAPDRGSALELLGSGREPADEMQRILDGAIFAAEGFPVSELVPR